MIITKYAMLIWSASVFDAIDWFVEVTNSKSVEGLVVGAVSITESNGSIVRSLVGSIDDVVLMIDGFGRDTAVELVGKIIEKWEGADVEGSIVVIGWSVGSIDGSSLHAVSYVVDIAIGSSIVISWHVSSVWLLLQDLKPVLLHSNFPLDPISAISQ